MKENIIKIVKSDSDDALYIGDNIEISVKDKTISNILVFIPSDLDQISIYDIYDIITGYIPDNKLISEEFDIIVDRKKAIKKMYFYDLLDKLKKYYPSLKEVHRTEIYNTPIYPKDIDVCGKDKTIAITVKYGYTTTSFSIPNLSKIYSSIYSERYKIYTYLLLTTGEVSFAFNRCKSDTLDAIYGISESLEELKKKYGKYVVTRPSTENDSKDKAIVTNVRKKENNAPDDYTRQGRDIRIHASYGTIDEIKLRIPLVTHSGILSNTHALRIYDIMTGHTVFSQFIAEEKLIKIDEDKYIKKIQSYDLLDELKKYYPCLEGIHRNKLYDEQLYPKSVNVCCLDNAVIITVKYGYYAFARDSFGINLTEIYSSISSGQSKLFNHLCCIPDNSNEKLKKADETIEKLKKRINAIYGAPVCLKEFEKKYQETESAEELKKKIAAAYALPTFDDFDAITDELKDTYIKKNHDYGNSFDKSIDKFGLTAAVVRMNDKMERLNSLLNKDAKVDESIRDTVMDLANYCIMTAMYLDNKEKK